MHASPVPDCIFYIVDSQTYYWHMPIKNLVITTKRLFEYCIKRVTYDISKIVQMKHASSDFDVSRIL